MPKNDAVATQKFVEETVKKTEKVLRREIGSLEERMDGLEEKMSKNHNEVMEKLDSMAGIGLIHSKEEDKICQNGPRSTNKSRETTGFSGRICSFVGGGFRFPADGACGLKT